MVFLCKLASGQRVALKRMFVNSEANLEVCRQEIRIWVCFQIFTTILLHEEISMFY